MSGVSRQDERDDATDERSVREFIGIFLGSVVAPTTGLAALLYYFGWVVTNAQARVFGLDESALNYSTQDYLLRSTGAIFVPLGGVLLFGLLWVWAHTKLSRWLEQPRSRKSLTRLVWSVLAAGIICVVVGLIGVIRPSLLRPIVPPLAFSIGIPLGAYGAFLHRIAQPAGRRAPTEPALRVLRITMVVLLVGLSLFWVIGEFAESVGTERALRAAQRLATRPSVTVYSAKRLHILGPGVQETEFPGPDSVESFRYSGLKLLFWANGKYFLVPQGWSVSNGTTIVLPDVGAFRFEFTSAG